MGLASGAGAGAGAGAFIQMKDKSKKDTYKKRADEDKGDEIRMRKGTSAVFVATCFYGR